MLRQSTDTFLFWQEATPQEVVKAVANGGGYQPEPQQVYIGALVHLFRKYLQRDAGAKELIFKPFHITDLPQELQAPVASVVLDYFLDQWPRRHAHNWLQDESWQKARLRLFVPPPNEEGNRYLRLRSVFDAAPGAGEKTLGTLPYGVAAQGQAVGEELTGSLPYGYTLDETQPPMQASAQDEVPPAATGAALALITSPLPTLDAASGEKMDTPITLEVERAPLRRALDEVQKQSGLRLSTAQAPVLDTLLLSSRTEKMPLFQLMNCLSRLYAIVWKKVDGGWDADASKRTPLAELALRVGGSGAYRFNETYKQGWDEERQNTEDIIDRLLELQDARALSSDPGLAFTALPEELQRSIREQVRVRASLGRAKQLASQQRLVNESVILQVNTKGRSMKMFLDGREFEPIIFGRSLLGADSLLDEAEGQEPQPRLPGTAPQAPRGQQP